MKIDPEVRAAIEDTLTQLERLRASLVACMELLGQRITHPDGSSDG